MSISLSNSFLLYVLVFIWYIKLMTVIAFEHCSFVHKSNIFCSFEAFSLNLPLSAIATFFLFLWCFLSLCFVFFYGGSSFDIFLFSSILLYVCRIFYSYLFCCHLHLLHNLFFFYFSVFKLFVPFTFTFYNVFSFVLTCLNSILKSR